MSAVVQGQKNVFRRVTMIQKSGGSNPGDPATGITAATSGLEIWYQRENEARVTDAGSAADASALTDAHVDWEFEEVGDGVYQIAFPDAAWVKDAANVAYGMKTDNASSVYAEIAIDHLLKFRGQASAATANTTTFPAGINVFKGDKIYVERGTGEGGLVLITSVSGQVATHGDWPNANISTTTSTIILIPGDEVTADGGINCDAAVSSRSDHTEDDVEQKLTEVVLAGVNLIQWDGSPVYGSGESEDDQFRGFP